MIGSDKHLLKRAFQNNVQFSQPTFKMLNVNTNGNKATEGLTRATCSFSQYKLHYQSILVNPKVNIYSTLCDKIKCFNTL